MAGTLSESHRPSDALELLLQEQKSLPTTLQISHAAEALKILNQALLGEDYHEATQTSPPAYTSTSQGVTLMLAPIGAYSFGCWDASAEIPCCVAGTPSEKIFYSIARKRLRRAAGNGITILKSGRSANTMFEIDISGIRFAIQYHQSPYVSQWSGADSIDVPDQLPGMSYMAKLRFNAFRDASYLSSIIRDRKVFKLSYLAVKLWAVRHGLFSTRFGYLNETQLLMMLAKVYSLGEPAVLRNPEGLVVKFFEFYSSFEYEQEAVLVRSESANEVRNRRAYGPGMAVLTYHAPIINASNVKSNLASNIIKSEVISTYEYVMKGNWDWASLVDGPRLSQLSTLSSLCPWAQQFLTCFPLYMKIDISYWGSSTTEVAKFFGWVDLEVSTFGNKLNDMIHSVSPRAWPTRFIDGSEIDPSTSTQYRAFYLLGLKPILGDMNTDTVIPAIDSFLTHLHANPHYDASNSWIGISTPTSSEFLNSPLMHDTKTRGPLPEEPTSKDDSSDSDPDSDIEFAPKPNLPTQPPPPNTHPRPLRPALDILHRIRHDPVLDPSAYTIGYEDRHAGILEMPVGWWKGVDSTDEEFIPQTRIMYFKRRSDGVRVWDRKGRVDLVFGSGRG